VSATHFDDACYTCWNESQSGVCQQAMDDCQKNPECVAFFSCWDTCVSDDKPCEKKCGTMHAAGAAQFAAFQACVCNEGCASECQDQCQQLRSLNRCRHDACTVGTDLDPDCAPCMKAFCEAEPYCCDFEWDSSCVAKAEAAGCCPAATCVHTECSTGAPLDPGCSPCAAAVCAARPVCCAPTGKWDPACVDATATLCGG
jgi:hypothetical protein